MVTYSRRAMVFVRLLGGCVCSVNGGYNGWSVIPMELTAIKLELVSLSLANLLEN